VSIPPLVGRARAAAAELGFVKSWRDVLPPHAPFDLIFVDGGRAKDDPGAVLGLAAPGAGLVTDDFSADWQGPDARRGRWRSHRASPWSSSAPATPARLSSRSSVASRRPGATATLQRGCGRRTRRARASRRRQPGRRRPDRPTTRTRRGRRPEPQPPVRGPPCDLSRRARGALLPGPTHSLRRGRGAQAAARCRRASRNNR
jgi:hypothetical protein